MPFAGRVTSVTGGLRARLLVDGTPRLHTDLPRGGRFRRGEGIRRCARRIARLGSPRWRTSHRCRSGGGGRPVRWWAGRRRCDSAALRLEAAAIAPGPGACLSARPSGLRGRGGFGLHGMRRITHTARRTRARCARCFSAVRSGTHTFPSAVSTAPTASPARPAPRGARSAFLVRHGRIPGWRNAAPARRLRFGSGRRCPRSATPAAVAVTRARVALAASRRARAAARLGAVSPAASRRVAPGAVTAVSRWSSRRGGGRRRFLPAPAEQLLPEPREQPCFFRRPGRRR